MTPADTRAAGQSGGPQLRRHPAAARDRFPYCWPLTASSGSFGGDIADEVADVSVRGSAVKRPGVSVSRTSRSALTLWATSAAMRSLSP